MGIKVLIGVYDSDNLIKALLPHYEKSYFNETYLLIEKKNALYKNGDSVFKLDDKKFRYNNDTIPSKLFCFHRAKGK